MEPASHPRDRIGALDSPLESPDIGVLQPQGLQLHQIPARRHGHALRDGSLPHGINGNNRNNTEEENQKTHTDAKMAPNPNRHLPKGTTDHFLN